MTAMPRTWLITGSSRGFGWELAKAVLDAGENLVAFGSDIDQPDGTPLTRGRMTGR